jgi:hypothetical protein
MHPKSGSVAITFAKGAELKVVTKFETSAPVARHGWGVIAVQRISSFFDTVTINVFVFSLSKSWLSSLLSSLLSFLLSLLLYMLAFVSVGSVLAGVEWRLKAKRARGVVTDAGGLSIDGVRFVERGAIVSAYCVPAEGGQYAAHIEGAWPGKACTVYLDSEQQGRALLAALQLSTAHFCTLHPREKYMRFLAYLPGYLAASALLIGNLPFWALGLIVAFFLAVSIAFSPSHLRSQRVDVGHDGVSLRWLWRMRFIPFSAIESVAKTQLGVELVLRDGRHVNVSLTPSKTDQASPEAALIACINEGITAQSAPATADEEASLARGGRDFETWIRDMRALGASQAGGYRAFAISRERLWAVVESLRADPSAREGAALGLSARLDENDRVRLATLAQNTMQPRLRVAFEGVSRELQEARLRVALEEAEGELDESAPESASSPCMTMARDESGVRPEGRSR